MTNSDLTSVKCNNPEEEEFSLKQQNFWGRLGSRTLRYYGRMMMLIIICECPAVHAFAISNPFAVAKTIIIDLYTQIAGISTVLSITAPPPKWSRPPALL